MPFKHAVVSAGPGSGTEPLSARDLQARMRRRRVSQYFLPFFGVVFASVALILGRTGLPENTPYLLFFIPVALSAGAGGLLPGLLATFLSAAACDFLLVAPHYSVEPINWVELPLALFILISLLVSAFSELLHISQRKAERARRDAVIAHQRIAFLAEASVALDTSLDYRRTLRSLARMVVPGLADWCAIEVMGDGSDRSLFAAGHQEPDKEPLIEALQGRYPYDGCGANPVQRVLNTGEPVIFVDIPDSTLVQSGRDPEHLRLMRELRIRSYLCVPLKARGRILGAMMFVSGARRRYSKQDVTLAQDLARRAALAADNARLYEAVQRELFERERTQAALVKSQEATAELNERLKRSVTETHHRVKNNLQVIAAMVDMLIMDDAEAVSLEELKRLASHIRTLAAVHDILTHETKSEMESGTVSVPSILNKLLGLMQDSTPNRPLRYTIDQAELSPKQGTSLALLTNELVSNAIKHGSGPVDIRLSRQNGAAVLEVADDGPGFPDGFDPRLSANTGIDLVESLSRWDLAGEVAYLNRPTGGAQVVVKFPVQDLHELPHRVTETVEARAA